MQKLQPYGFDVGESERGNVLKGLDLGVEGMRIGGQVRSDSKTNQICVVTNFTRDTNKLNWIRIYLPQDFVLFF